MHIPSRTGLLALALVLGACDGMTPYNPDALERDSGYFNNGNGNGLNGNGNGNLDPLDVATVEPAFGTNAGGLTVTIHGGPFDASAVATFGGQAATVLSHTTDQLQVRTPAYSGTGEVDVRVVTDTHSGTGTAAYNYWLDGTDKYGPVGAIEWYQYVGGYWGSPAPASFGAAWLFFNTPSSLEVKDLFAPSTGSCVRNFSYSGTLLDPYTPGATTAQLTGAATINVPRHPESTWYYTTDITSSQFAQFGTYGLAPMSGAANWPSFSVPSLAATPGSFSVSSPQIHGSSAPFVAQSFNLSWTNAGSGTYMLATLLRWQGGSVVDEVTCVMADTGSFTVPSSVWSGWSLEDQLTIVVGRAREAGGTMPYDNSRSGVVGVYWVIGAAWQWF